MTTIMRALGCLAAGAAVAASAACSVSSPAPQVPVKSPVAQSSTPVGGSFRYPDGVAISVVSISRGRFGPQAVGHPAGNVPVKVVVKVTNGSSAPVDVEHTVVNLHTGKDGMEATSVFDPMPGSDAGRGLSGSVPPGSSSSATIGFSVAPANLGAAHVDVMIVGGNRVERPSFVGTIS